MRVYLIKKVAESIGGIDLQGHMVGDVLDLEALKPKLLIVEGWAALERQNESNRAWRPSK